MLIKFFLSFLLHLYHQYPIIVTEYFFTTYNSRNFQELDALYLHCRQSEHLGHFRIFSTKARKWLSCYDWFTRLFPESTEMTEVLRLDNEVISRRHGNDRGVTIGLRGYFPKARKWPNSYGCTVEVKVFLKQK